MKGLLEEREPKDMRLTVYMSAKQAATLATLAKQQDRSLAGTLRALINEKAARVQESTPCVG